jgi:tetratricopeptide (TPR) repeat protein
VLSPARCSRRGISTTTANTALASTQDSLTRAYRLLSLLGLAVPSGLEPLNRVAVNVPVEVAAAAERPQAPTNLFGAEVARLGESGGRLAEILARAFELSRALDQHGRQGFLALDPENPDFDTFLSRLIEAYESIGAEVIELLAETNQLEADRAELGDDVLDVLTTWVRCELSSHPLGLAARSHASTLELTRLADERRRLDSLDKWVEQRDRDNAPPESEPPNFDEARLAEVRHMIAFVDGHSDRWQEMIRLASQLDEANPLANLSIVRADLALAGGSMETGPEGGWNSEALPFVRDAIARLRLEAGREPGSVFETSLVFALRVEGEICNDLGRTDEAIQAFARADEIVDRYPAADPAFLR